MEPLSVAAGGLTSFVHALDDAAQTIGREVAPMRGMHVSVHCLVLPPAAGIIRLKWRG